MAFQNDQLLERYVLDLLPIEETERLDEATIVDDEVASRLRIVENALVDAYVRGALAGKTLERFESYYLASPRRRERVRLAASLPRAAERARERAERDNGGSSTPGFAREPERDPRLERSVSDRMRPGARLMAGLAAAAALLLVAGGTLLFQAMLPRNGSNPTPADRVATERQPRELERQGTTPSGDRLASNEPAVAQPMAAAGSRSVSAATGTGGALKTAAIALVLRPQTRAIAPIATLAAPRSTDRPAFELLLESNDFSRYQIGLRDPATNQIVWRSGWIAATSFADRLSVSVVVPAGLLKPQHYSLDVVGRGAAGGTELVGSYGFQIVPR